MSIHPECSLLTLGEFLRPVGKVLITHVTQKDKNLYHVAPSAYVTTPADRLGLEH